MLDRQVTLVHALFNIPWLEGAIPTEPLAPPDPLAVMGFSLASMENNTPHRDLDTAASTDLDIIA